MDHHHESEVACGDGGGAAAGGEQLDLTIDLDGEQLIFSDDPFPLLPDFPCINSPPASPMPTSAGNPCFSSSSSTSSSASSSWVFNSAASSGSAIVPTLSEERDVIDILNEIDILDPAFDPSLLFSDESTMVEPVSDTQTSGEGDVFGGSNGNSLNCLFGRDGSSEELAEIFLEWLKSNKDSISREDLRNIKIQKATIDSALRRLGSDKQGRAKLFKLILTWVQNHHLQKKHRLQHHQNAFPAFSSPYQNHNQHFPFNPVPIIPNNNPNMEYNNEAEPNITGCNTWSPYCDPSMMMNYTGGAMPYQFPGSSFVGCPTGWTGPPNFGVAAPPPPYLFPAPSAPIAPAHYPVGFTAGQQMYPGQPFVASVPSPAPAPGPISATREARKRRAQQRRYSVRSHNNNISKSQQQVHHHRPQKNHISRLAAAQETQKTSTLRLKHIDVQAVPPAPTPPLPQASSPVPTPPLPQVSSPAPSQPQVSSPATLQPQVVSPLRQQLNLQNGARHQGLKGDKKMTLLFQKMLKQSDVNGLGRIVLPKKEAELHLPALEGRDGISLVMEEIGTSRVWSMRFRFWPNNKSRMYLLENTAEFIRLNGLQEGDFIVIYLDTKCNKYLIKGIKNSEAQRAANRKRGILEKVGAAKSRILGSPSAQRYTVIDSDYDNDDDYDISMLEVI